MSFLCLEDSKGQFAVALRVCHLYTRCSLCSGGRVQGLELINGYGRKTPPTPSAWSKLNLSPRGKKPHLLKPGSIYESHMTAVSPSPLKEPYESTDEPIREQLQPLQLWTLNHILTCEYGPCFSCGDGIFIIRQDIKHGTPSLTEASCRPPALAPITSK